MINTIGKLSAINLRVISTDATPLRVSRWNLHPNCIVHHLSFEPWMDQRLARLMLAGYDVELPTVPGAGDDAAVEPALSEGPTLVWADAIEGEELAIDVE